MEAEKRKKIMMCITVFFIVFIVSGLLPDYSDAGYEEISKCRTRWNEPIGPNCRAAAAKEMAPTVEYLPEELPEAGYKTECYTRWGEPIGPGCRILIDSKFVPKARVPEEEIPRIVKQDYKCRARWGELIGPGCRIVD